MRRGQDILGANMHEMSLIASLVDQVRAHMPSEGILRQVFLRAGPLQSIDPEALRMAWQVMTTDTPYAGAVLELDLLPWHMTCDACARQWDSPEMATHCACGSNSVTPTGSDMLCLVSLEVDDAPIIPSSLVPALPPSGRTQLD